MKKKICLNRSLDVKDLSVDVIIFHVFSFVPHIIYRESNFDLWGYFKYDKRRQIWFVFRNISFVTFPNSNEYLMINLRKVERLFILYSNPNDLGFNVFNKFMTSVKIFHNLIDLRIIWIGDHDFLYNQQFPKLEKLMYYNPQYLQLDIKSNIKFLLENFPKLCDVKISESDFNQFPDLIRSRVQLYWIEKVIKKFKKNGKGKGKRNLKKLKGCKVSCEGIINTKSKLIKEHLPYSYEKMEKLFNVFYDFHISII